MNFTVAEIEEKKQWQELSDRCREKSFMQSWSSKEWREAMGQKAWLMGVFNQDNLVGGTLVAEMPMIKKFGLDSTFFFLPHGPLIDRKYVVQRQEITSALLADLESRGRQDKKVSFLRVSPAWDDTEENRSILKNLKLRKAPMFIVPEVTWQLDITLSEEELLRGMRKTTRYLIRKGLSNPGLTAEIGQGKKDFNVFLELYRETVDRHDFQSFSLDYLEKEMEILGKEDQVSIINAYYQGKPLASAMIIFHQGVAYYHQGASIGAQPKDAPGSYLVQWAAIKEAKHRGCQYYNFWGIADREDDPDHGYHGLTLFKKGFGGQRLDYLPTHDMVLRWPYWLNYFIEKKRRHKRKL